MYFINLMHIHAPFNAPKHSIFLVQRKIMSGLSAEQYDNFFEIACVFYVGN